MKKLWLTKTRACGYEVWRKEPHWDEGRRTYCGDNYPIYGQLSSFCTSLFERYCPQMKLKMNEKRRLIATKTGIRLERKK